MAVPVEQVLAGDAAGPGPVEMPYTADQDIGQGVKCHTCGTFTAKTWLSMLSHHRRTHHVLITSMSGTFLHAKAKEERNEQVRKNYKPKSKKAKAKGDPPAVDEAMDGDEAEGDDKATAKEAKSKHGEAKGDPKADEESKGEGQASLEVPLPPRMLGDWDHVEYTYQQNTEDLEHDDRVMHNADGSVFREPDGSFWIFPL